MYAKTVAALPLVAALVEQANAISLHRHQHQVDKRSNVVWETVWETVVVTANAEAPAASDAFVAANKPVATETVFVAPSAAPAPPPAAAPAQQAAAAPPAPAPPASSAPQTTLATAVKPSIQLSSSLGLPVATSASKPVPTAGVEFSKRGIAYNDPKMANTFKSNCKGCGWAYNWASSPQGLDSSIPFIPLLWGDLPVHTNRWDSDAEAALAKGAKALLSFNEPDMATQANMAPGVAAAAHAKYFKKYSGRALIGSPAVTNSGEVNQGIDWLTQFMSACNAQSGGCPVDFCVVHWYSQAQYANTLFDHLEKARTACGGKPVWLTEFAPFGSDDEISSFMKTNLPKLEALDYLHAYSYFMVAQNQLMSSSTSLSSIGNVYAALS